MLNSIFTKKGDEKSDRIFYTITKKMTHTDLPINYPKTKKNLMALSNTKDLIPKYIQMQLLFMVL